MGSKILCTCCETVSADRPSHLMHVRVWHPISEKYKKCLYACPVCRQRFADYSTLQKHRRVHFPTYSCRVCRENFPARSDLRKHILEKHRNLICCKVCYENFSTKSDMRKHFIEKHGNPICCNHCKKSYRTHTGLRTHMRIHHIETKALFICDECGKTLNTRNGLVAHLEIHKFGGGHVCPFCGDRFNQKINLKIHIDRNHKEKLFTCPACEKTFNNEAALELHSELHTSLRKYRCKICDKTFKTDRYMKIHFARHNNGGSHECGVCGKKFTTTTKLKYHINTHTGERPFNCQFCSSTFTNLPNRMKHERRKHKDKTPKNGESKLSVPDTKDVNHNKGDPISAIPDNMPHYNFNENFSPNYDNLNYPIENKSNYDISSNIFTNDKITFYYDYGTNDLSDISASARLLEEELELCHSYVREQMNGCDLNNFKPLKMLD